MRQLLRITATFALALVFTAGMAFGQTSVDLEQSGGSTANITQNINGSNGSATLEGLRGGSMSGGDALTQEGGSTLNITQKQVWGGSPSQLIEGEQEGSGHFAGIKQFSLSGHGQTAEVDQTGSSNVVRLNQTAQGSGASSGNDAVIEQNGSDILKGVSFFTVVDPMGRAGGEAKQQGLNNFLCLIQGTGSNTLYTGQYGVGNTLQLDQQFSSYAEIIQDGDDNILAANEDGTGKYPSENADLYVKQSGDGNVVHGGQTSSMRDVAYVDQNGGDLRLVQQ